MRVLAAFRDRRFRLARFAAWCAIYAAASFALLQVLHAPASAAAAALAATAPPGYTLVCTAEGVRLIPDDPALPAPADPAPVHATCLHACCAAPTAALAALPMPVPTAALDGVPHAALSATAPALAPRGQPTARGPPAA